MIFESRARMSRLKKKVAHPDETRKVFWVYTQTGFQMLGSFLEIVALQILYSKLTLRLVVFWVQLNDSFVNRDGLFSHVSDEVEGFGKTKVRWYWVWLEFYSVFEVLSSLYVVTCIGEQGCQMNTSAKVLLIQNKTLLKHSVSFLNVTVFLINNTEIKVSTCVNAIWSPYCLLVTLLSGSDIILFFKDPTSNYHRVYVVFFHHENLQQVILRFLKLLRLSFSK